MKSHFIRYKFINSYLKRNRAKILILLFIFTVISGLNYVFPFFSIYIIDTLIPQNRIKMLFYCSIGMLGLYSFKLWVEYILQIKLLQLRESFGKELQLKLLRRMKFLPYHEIEKDSKEGFYVDTLRNINTIKSIIDQRMMGILTSFFSLFIGLILIYMISEVMFILLIVFFLLVIPFILKKQKKLRDIEKKTDGKFWTVFTGDP